MQGESVCIPDALCLWPSPYQQVGKMNKTINLLNFSTFRVGSAFYTLAVTVERYVAISRPLFVEKKRLKRVLILTASSISFAYNLPRYVYLILKLSKWIVFTLETFNLGSLSSQPGSWRPKTWTIFTLLLLTLHVFITEHKLQLIILFFLKLTYLSK